VAACEPSCKLKWKSFYPWNWKIESFGKDHAKSFCKKIGGNWTWKIESYKVKRSVAWCAELLSNLALMCCVVYIALQADMQISRRRGPRFRMHLRGQIHVKFDKTRNRILLWIWASNLGGDTVLVSHGRQSGASAQRIWKQYICWFACGHAIGDMVSWFRMRCGEGRGSHTQTRFLLLFLGAEAIRHDLK
jgi:hypothetical protein